MEKPAQIHGIYNRAVLTTKVLLNISEIGSNIKQILEQHISHRVKNKCQAEGYIRYNTIEILEYSQGLVKGIHQEFQVVYECLVCHPSEGMIIDQIECKNISIAGVRGVYYDNETRTTPLEIFLAKDFHYDNKAYDKIKEGSVFSVQVIGIRFELNDDHITVMGLLHVSA
jgi:DNA-directed RNA polymerase subunit E'/Rpb7